MRESTMYQSILREGEAQGRAAEGRNLVLKQLTRKLGNLSIAQTNTITALSLDRVEALGEALLDFTGVADLEAWLEQS